MKAAEEGHFHLVRLQLEYRKETVSKGFYWQQELTSPRMEYTMEYLVGKRLSSKSMRLLIRWLLRVWLIYKLPVVYMKKLW